MILGMYYPGAFVIFLSVILAGRDVSRVAEVVLIVTAAFAIGLSIDYLLGRYGWHKLLLRLGFRHEMEESEKRLRKRGLAAIFFTYWEVNIASFTATAAGILRYPFGKFLLYSVPAILFWNSFWAAMIFIVGRRALDLVSGRGGYALAVIGIWTAALVTRHIIENRRAEILSRPDGGY